LLLVANGAGVAPFIALLELLAAGRFVGGAPAVQLWMGCRRRADALPHSSRLEAFARAGVLQTLRVAESRPSSGQRQLVQDLLRGDADELGRLLFPGSGGCQAIVLVCGAASMGASVREVVAEVAATCGSSIEALEQERRFVAELW